MGAGQNEPNSLRKAMTEVSKSGGMKGMVVDNERDEPI